MTTIREEDFGRACRKLYGELQNPSGQAVEGVDYEGFDKFQERDPIGHGEFTDIVWRVLRAAGIEIEAGR